MFYGVMDRRLLVFVMIFMVKIAMIRSQGEPVARSISLTPGSPKIDSINILTHIDEVTRINENTEWSLLIKRQNTWQFIIVLDDTWGFNEENKSQITLTVNSPTEPTAPGFTRSVDDIIFGFATNNYEYIAMAIPIGDSVPINTNKIYPNCFTDAIRKSKFAFGDIAAIPFYNRRCDISSGNCELWQDMQPEYPDIINTFPITVTFVNDPITNTLHLSLHSLSSPTQTCVYQNFPTNQGLKIYFGGNENGQQFEVNSFDLQYSILVPVASTINTKTPTSNPILKSVNPTLNPSSIPSINPSFNPTLKPSFNPTFNPSSNPSLNPSSNPTLKPSSTPTFNPSSNASLNPSSNPTLKPSYTPTFNPSSNPSLNPSSNPSLKPSFNPTSNPSLKPSFNPTSTPTPQPTPMRTSNPTLSPSSNHTLSPSSNPTLRPSSNPTLSPSFNPTLSPSFNPTLGPSFNPTLGPSFNPTLSPSFNPTLHPSFNPNIQIPLTILELGLLPNPTSSPTLRSTATPTSNPTSTPTLNPTAGPIPMPQWTDIFFEDMLTNNNGWTTYNEVTFGTLSRRCPAGGRCARINGCHHDRGGNSYIEKEFDITGYMSIRFQVNIRGSSLEAGNQCEIWYAYGSNVESEAAVFDTNTNVFDFVYELPTPSHNNLKIKIMARGDSTNYPCGDRCYWGDFYIQGLS